MITSRLPHRLFFRRLVMWNTIQSPSCSRLAAVICGRACPLTEPLQYISANEPPNGRNTDHSAGRSRPLCVRVGLLLFTLSSAPSMLQIYVWDAITSGHFDQFRRLNPDLKYILSVFFTWTLIRHCRFLIQFFFLNNIYICPNKIQILIF